MAFSGLDVVKTHLDIKKAAYIDAIVDYAGKLLGIVFKPVKKNRYNAMCPFHADAEDKLIIKSSSSTSGITWRAGALTNLLWTNSTSGMRRPTAMPAIKAGR